MVRGDEAMRESGVGELDALGEVEQLKRLSSRVG
jgi:hypothetical protein